MADTLELTALQRAVDTEASNHALVQPLYAEAALDIATLFEKGDTDGIHLYMCAAQDRTGDPLVWKKSMQGMRDSVKALSDPLRFTGTRDFRETHRAKSPLFMVEKVSTLKEAKKAADKEAAEKAAAIEKAAAEKKAADQAAADAEVTEHDIAQAALAECKRLNLSPTDVMTAMSLDAAIIDGDTTVQIFATDLARLHGLETIQRHKLENMQAELDSLRKQLEAAQAKPRKRTPRTKVAETKAA